MLFDVVENMCECVCCLGMPVCVRVYLRKRGRDSVSLKSFMWYFQLFSFHKAWQLYNSTFLYSTPPFFHSTPPFINSTPLNESEPKSQIILFIYTYIYPLTIVRLVFDENRFCVWVSVCACEDRDRRKREREKERERERMVCVRKANGMKE